MDKQTLNTVSSLVAEDVLAVKANAPNEGESLQDYVARVYPEFEAAVSASGNSVVTEIANDSADPLKNAISKLEIRRLLAEAYCEVNDPFEVEAPEEATVADILAHNEVQGTEKQLRKIMGDVAFDAYIKKLRTPKSDGLSKTQVAKLREEHMARYEPLFPSEKEYTHNNGGTTRDYHWQASLQGEFVEDHERFLSEFGLSDSFPVEPEVESESEASDSEADAEG